MLPRRVLYRRRIMQLNGLLPCFRQATFSEPATARARLKDACRRHPNVASFEVIGTSEQGRPIDGIGLGRGDVSVSLIAGNHSDEPVGPEFLRRFVVAILDRADELRPMMERWRFRIVPHTNPDGEAANRAWCARWPEFDAYLEHAFRERPGRDVEFGFPDMRKENAVVADWLRASAPYRLHGSLHGMGLSEGALLLIEQSWGYRTVRLQETFLRAVREEGLLLHDHNRQGEKGFFYLGPGFWTTPEGGAMRSFFRARGDVETASRFHDSSMEFVRSLGGDPLCYVTELPLFVVEKDPDAPSGVPGAYLAFKDRLPQLRLRLARGETIEDEVDRFGIRALAVDKALRLQLRILSAAMDAVAPHWDSA